MSPIRGYSGTLSVNSTNVGWVSSWEASVETESQEIGPFINDAGRIYAFKTSSRITGSIDATIPNGKDGGQTILVSGGLNDAYLNISLVTTGGYTITIPSGLITNFSITQDAAETVNASFDFMSNGTFTVV